MTDETISIFVAGDLHIPTRATMLHPKFAEILYTRKWDYIVLTGDLTQITVLEYFKGHVKDPNNLIACRGNMDMIPLPVYPTFDVTGIKFGAYHGTGIHPRGDIKQLKEIAREKNVKVLFSGHSHQTQFHTDDDHILLNPGTSTGASGGTSWTVSTGIMVLSVLNEKEILLEHYYLNKLGKLKNQPQTISL